MSIETQDDHGHGHTPAAWTAVIIMLIGFTLGTIFFWFNLPVGVWASLGVVIVGLIVGGIMKKAGYGVGGAKLKGH